MTYGTNETASFLFVFIFETKLGVFWAREACILKNVLLNSTCDENILKANVYDLSKFEIETFSFW